MTLSTAQSTRRRWYEQPWHLLFLALFPALFLYSHNLNLADIPLAEVTRPIVATAIVVALLVGLSRLIIHDFLRASLLASLTTFLFFSYDHVVELFRIPYSSHGWLDLTGGLIVIAASIALVRTKRQLRRLTWFANIITLTLVASTALRFGAVLWEYRDIAATIVPKHDVTTESVPTVRPDIYYIILDGYGRDDVLREQYGFDNSAFLQSLTDVGFTVEPESVSNYSLTGLTVSSTLNMEYLTTLLGDDWQSQYTSVYTPVAPLVQKNDVMRVFRHFGYDITSYSSGYAKTELINVDERIEPKWNVTELENIFIGTTPVSYWVPAFRDIPYDLHRRRITHMFDVLDDPITGGPPRFVFIHSPVPHPPFVFTDTGEGIAPSTPYTTADDIYFEGDNLDVYRDLYLDQLRYVNTRTLASLSTLIEQRTRPTIILLQSDHGPGSHYANLESSDETLWERQANFSAMYVSDDVPVEIPSIKSPVNNFRVLFSSLFGMNTPALPDRIFFSSPLDMFTFRELEREPFLRDE